MSVIEIFGAQFVLSLLVVTLLAVWRLGPWLNSLSLPDALFWLTVPHAFRHLGLVFEVPGVVSPDMPGSFSLMASYGDLAAGLLAIVTLVALRLRWTIMIPMAWLTTVVGAADLGNALTHIEAVPHFQSAWYIPTFIVPVLLVTHAMTLLRLVGSLRGADRPAPAK